MGEKGVDAFLSRHKRVYLLYLQLSFLAIT